MTLFEAITLRYLENIDQRTRIMERILRHNHPNHDNDPEIAVLTERLRAGTEALSNALASAGPHISPANSKGTTLNPILQQLADQVTATTTIEASAVALIQGIAQRISDAVLAALANGATAEQLAAVQAEADALKSSAETLSGAIAANTAAAPQVAHQAKKK